MKLKTASASKVLGPQFSGLKRSLKGGFPKASKPPVLAFRPLAKPYTGHKKP